MLGLDRRTVYLFLALCLGHVLLISAQVQSRSGLPLAETVAFGGFAKVQEGLAAASDGVTGIWSGYLALHGVAADNTVLRRRVLDLEGQLQQAQAEASRARGLESALKLQQSIPARTLAARVIAGDPSPGSLTVTIDRGSADGVEPDMALIGPQGLVGRVINRPMPHASQVQLIVGRNACAAVTFERSGAGGVACGGNGDPPLRVDLVPDSADVKPGDRVLTSGQDNLFPRGFLVGLVEQATHRSGTWTIALRPTVDFSHLDVVLVMLDKPRLIAAGSGS